MTTPNDGGPAFPVPSDAMILDINGSVAFASSYGGGPEKGMTLRDFFAAKAMAGLLARSAETMVAGEILKLPSDYATVAYFFADAMLAERAKDTGNAR